MWWWFIYVRKRNFYIDIIDFTEPIFINYIRMNVIRFLFYYLLRKMRCNVVGWCEILVDWFPCQMRSLQIIFWLSFAVFCLSIFKKDFGFNLRQFNQLSNCFQWSIFFFMTVIRPLNNVHWLILYVAFCLKIILFHTKFN